MAFSTGSITRASSRRPKLTIALWVILIALSGFISSRWLGDALTSDIDFTNRPEAKRAAELVEERFGKQGITELILLSSEGATVDDASFQQAARGIQAEAMRDGSGVRGALTFYDAQDPSLVSSDRHTTLIPVIFNESGEISDKYPVVQDIVAAGNGVDGFQAQAFGSITLDHDFSKIAEEDLKKGESFGVVIALIVLVAVFGAIVAGVVPIAMGVASITVATGITAVVGQFFDFSFFVTNMISMMGLAVGIDYSLFIVSRYREERHRGLEKLDAIAAAGATASRAVFFSGMTVVFALAGMLGPNHTGGDGSPGDQPHSRRGSAAGGGVLLPGHRDRLLGCQHAAADIRCTPGIRHSVTRLSRRAQLTGRDSRRRRCHLPGDQAGHRRAALPDGLGRSLRAVSNRALRRARRSAHLSAGSRGPLIARSHYGRRAASRTLCATSVREAARRP